MKRLEIRQLKRAVVHENDREAMLRLLERSVQFGHKKLALLRCLQAEKLGIPVTPELLTYCRDVADNLPKDVLYDVLSKAASFGRPSLQHADRDRL